MNTHIYSFDPDTNNYLAVNFDHHAFDGPLRSGVRQLVRLFLDNDSIADAFEKITVVDLGDQDHKTLGDFVTFCSFYRIPILGPRAMSVLWPHLERHCERIPVEGPWNVELTMVNPRHTPALLDEERSLIYRSSTTGNISTIYEYAFTGIEPECPLFKLPKHQGAETLITEAFRKLVEEHKLTGLHFRTLKRSAHAIYPACPPEARSHTIQIDVSGINSVDDPK